MEPVGKSSPRLPTIPHFGRIVSFSESSATPNVNSVWEARSNRKAAQSALCASVVGKVPEYGLLLSENRRATIKVMVEADLSDDLNFQPLGWETPGRNSLQIPVFVGIAPDVSPEALMNLGAQLNTAGMIPIYHIVRVIAEAVTEEAALQGKKPEEVVRVTKRDLEEELESISAPSGPINFVMFDCPYHTIRQVQETATIVAG